MLAIGAAGGAPTPTSARRRASSSASALPTNLAAAAKGPAADKYTTPDVEPLTRSNVDALGLARPAR